MDLIVIVVIFVTILGLAVILASVFLFHKFRTSRIARGQSKTILRVPSNRRFKLENGRVVPANEVQNSSIKTPSVRSHWSAIQSHPSWLWSRLFLPRENSSSLPDLEANRDHFMQYAVGAHHNPRHSAPVMFIEKRDDTISITDTVLNPTPSLPPPTDSKRSSVASSFHTCPSRPNLIFIPGRKNSASNRLARTESLVDEPVQRSSTLLLPQSKFCVKQEDSNWISRSPLCSSPPILASELVPCERNRKSTDVVVTEDEILESCLAISPSTEPEGGKDDGIFGGEEKRFPTS